MRRQQSPRTLLRLGLPASKSRTTTKAVSSAPQIPRRIDHNQKPFPACFSGRPRGRTRLKSLARIPQPNTLNSTQPAGCRSRAGGLCPPRPQGHRHRHVSPAARFGAGNRSARAPRAPPFARFRFFGYLISLDISLSIHLLSVDKSQEWPFALKDPTPGRHCHSVPIPTKSRPRRPTRI